MSSVTQHAKVKATFTDLRTGIEEVRELDLTYDGRVVQLHGGPTGYESFIAEHRSPEHRGVDWVACAGTEGRWRQCVVDGRSLSWRSCHSASRR
jgi:hypothetical protein